MPNPPPASVAAAGRPGAVPEPSTFAPETAHFPSTAASKVPRSSGGGSRGGSLDTIKAVQEGLVVVPALIEELEKSCSIVRRAYEEEGVSLRVLLRTERALRALRSILIEQHEAAARSYMRIAGNVRDCATPPEEGLRMIRELHEAQKNDGRVQKLAAEISDTLIEMRSAGVELREKLAEAAKEAEKKTKDAYWWRNFWLIVGGALVGGFVAGGVACLLGAAAGVVALCTVIGAVVVALLCWAFAYEAAPTTPPVPSQDATGDEKEAKKKQPSKPQRLAAEWASSQRALEDFDRIRVRVKAASDVANELKAKTDALFDSAEGVARKCEVPLGAAKDLSARIDAVVDEIEDEAERLRRAATVLRAMAM